MAKPPLASHRQAAVDKIAECQMPPLGTPQTTQGNSCTETLSHEAATLATRYNSPKLRKNTSATQPAHTPSREAYDARHTRCQRNGANRSGHHWRAMGPRCTGALRATLRAAANKFKPP